MAKKPPGKVYSEKTYVCHPKNPCGSCFACVWSGTKGWNSANKGADSCGFCLLNLSLMLTAPAIVLYRALRKASNT
jgi:hypothetical protein